MTIDEYIDSHISPEPEPLRKVGRRTQLELLNPRMCSGHLQGRLLTMLTTLKQPRVAVELGTYAAYSTLCIAEGMPADGHLYSLEVNDELEDFIKESLAGSPHGSKVSVHFGPALSLLETVAPGQCFDLAFMDANKREYPAYYEALRRRMNLGGLIIADNTLWDGHVVEPDNHDAQTEGIRRFNDMVAADPGVEKVILPMRDGLTLIYIK
ncbi:MAG: O-methyltransferase [Muribaculaceae bacterium]|nr:O-methyltransferase [Muribaculaceae bacterium]